jgi:polyribonucleotide nucleotidyltransferase
MYGSLAIKVSKTRVLIPVNSCETTGLGRRSCKVANVENFGLFVEFLPGRQGLLHISELARGEELETFKPEDTIDVLLAAVTYKSPLWSREPLDHLF